MARRRTELAERTANRLRELAAEMDIETVARELHRIVGTCGSYGLMDGSQRAAVLLARVREKHVDGLAVELNTLAEIFILSAGGGES